LGFEEAKLVLADAAASEAELRPLVEFLAGSARGIIR
jgi:hypothetical protein